MYFYLRDVSEDGANVRGTEIYFFFFFFFDKFRFRTVGGTAYASRGLKDRIDVYRINDNRWGRSELACRSCRRQMATVFGTIRAVMARKCFAVR